MGDNMEIFNAFDNIFGGHDYTVNGHNYQSHDNIFGGHDTYEDGKIIESTHDNIFRGHDIYENGKLVGSTHGNAFGGQDLYSDNHVYEGSTHQNASGISFIDSSGTQTFTTHEMGNITSVLSYSDPLTHVGSYIMPTMIL